MNGTRIDLILNEKTRFFLFIRFLHRFKNWQKSIVDNFFFLVVYSKGVTWNTITVFNWKNVSKDLALSVNLFAGYIHLTLNIVQRHSAIDIKHFPLFFYCFAVIILCFFNHAGDTRIESSQICNKKNRKTGFDWTWSSYLSFYKTKKSTEVTLTPSLNLIFWPFHWSSKFREN